MPKVSESHREERRRQIAAGARRAFARYGYEGATVPRLEEETGLSRGAIFSYHPSKLDLFLSLAEADQERLLTIWLEHGFEGVVRDVAANPEWIGLYLDVPRMLRADPALRARWEQFNPELQAELTAKFVELQDAGAFRSDLSIQTIGNFHGAILDGLAVHLGAGYEIDVEGTLELLQSALAPK